MMRSVKRWVAIGLTGAVAAVGLEVATPGVASATQVELNCQGITGDNASSLGDSKATIGLLSTLSPGGGSGLTFPVEVTTDAPAKATPGAGPFDVNFDIALTLPDSVVKPARDLLKLSSVKVENATFAVAASGAADAELVTSVPSLTVDLNASPVVVRQRISGKVDPKRSGTILYKPSTSTKMTIAINAEVAGVKINALTVTCSSNKEAATTAVQIPGSPNITQPLYQVAWTATVVGRPLIGKDITPDAGNPIDANSLALTSQAPNGGYSAVGGGAAFFLAPREPGLYNAQYSVCAASKIIPEVPGVNTVQTLSWPESYVGRDMNAHPLSVALSFRGQKTAPISLAQDPFGNPSPLLESQTGFLDAVFAHFAPPSAATVQAALEKLSTIGAGNVSVTGGGGAPYTITFKGALGLSDQPKIEVVDFQSWLPGSVLTGALAALNPPPPTTVPGATTTTAVPALPRDQIWGQLLGGQISFERFTELLGATIKKDLIGGLTTPENIATLTKLFPKPPEVAVATAGKPTVPQSETGPLCSAFTVGYFVIPNPFLQAQVLGASTTRTTKCSYVRVKSKGKYVKKRVCKKVAAKR